MRVLIANSAAAAAATSHSAHSSPKADAVQGPNPFQNTADEPPAAAAAVTAPAEEAAGKAEQEADIDSELAHLQKLISEEGGKQEQPTSDSGHLLGAVGSGRAFPVGVQRSSHSAEDAGHMLASQSSKSPSWERAHSVPVLPLVESFGEMPRSHAVHSVESMASLAADDIESVLSAPGNVEKPVTSVEEAALETDALLLRGATSGDPCSLKNGIVSRYVMMFEAHKPAISLPAWQRQELRGHSTDLVLRFLNRHRRPRGRQPPVASPEGAAAADTYSAPPTHHNSDSDENSGSEDEHDEGTRDDEHADSDSAGVRTPDIARSPVRGRSCSTGSASGTPVHPSRLGDASRAAVAEHVSAFPCSVAHVLPLQLIEGTT